MFTTKFSQTILRNHLGFITTCAIKLCFMQRQDSLTFINFQENYQTAEIYFCSHMLLHSVKQYLIIVSTSFSQFYSLTLLFLLKLRIFTTEIKYAITIMLSMQEGCIMLFTYYSYLFLFLPERKRSVELCKRKNNIFKACLQD